MTGFGESACYNVKGLLNGRPPLIIFVICLGLFGVVLMTLAYIIKESQEIPDIDGIKDWNAFLDKISAFEFCMFDLNETDSSSTVATPGLSTITPRLVTNIDHSEVTSVIPDDGMRNYSVSVWVTFQPTLSFLSIPHNITYVTGTILGHQIGLKGIAGHENITLSLTLPIQWNNLSCVSSCPPVKVLTCLNIYAHGMVFPYTNRDPEICELLNDTGVSHYSHMRAKTTTRMMLPYYCQSRPVLTLSHKIENSLLVYLTVEDRSVINLHLMNTSYFLFIMVIFLLCYGVIRGKSKAQHQDAEKLLAHVDS